MPCAGYKYFLSCCALIKNEEKYDPSMARLLMPKISHDYLDNFEKNAVGLNTTEQIVDLIVKNISLDRKNKQQKSQHTELISELEAEAKIKKDTKSTRYPQ